VGHGRPQRPAPALPTTSYGGFERLSSYPGTYAYGFCIGYHAHPPFGTGAVAGKGSAFFFHVRNASATGGCVAVAEWEMNWLIRWLRFSATPIVSIGVGAAAYAPIPSCYI